MLRFKNILACLMFIIERNHFIYLSVVGRLAEQTTNMPKQHSHHEVKGSFTTTWSFCEG